MSLGRKGKAERRVKREAFSGEGRTELVDVLGMRTEKKCKRSCRGETDETNAETGYDS